MKKQRPKRRSRAKQQLPTPADYQRVDYLEARNRFLVARENMDEVEWLVQVGRYVQHCWLAEEANRGDGDFNEMSHWDVWDHCDEAKYRDLRTEAVSHLHAYSKARQWRSLAGHIVGGLRKHAGIWWHVQELYRGFLGGIGIVLFGLFFALVAPKVVKAVRGAVDDILPESTQPVRPPETTKVSPVTPKS